MVCNFAEHSSLNVPYYHWFGASPGIRGEHKLSPVADGIALIKVPCDVVVQVRAVDVMYHALNPHERNSVELDQFIVHQNFWFYCRRQGWGLAEGSSINPPTVTVSCDKKSFPTHENCVWIYFGGVQQPPGILMEPKSEPQSTKSLSCDPALVLARLPWAQELLKNFFAVLEPTMTSNCPASLPNTSLVLHPAQTFDRSYWLRQ